MKKYQITMALISAVLLLGLSSMARAADKKVKVFILAGQSNMEGHGMLSSLDHLGNHPKYGHLIKRLKNRDGSWATRDDVTVYWNKESKEEKHGPLSTDWGAMTGKSIGPELMFGTNMGQRYDDDVLLIKTAWGGKSVWCDFRSPGADEMTWDEKRILKRDHWLKPGHFYRKMVAEIKECLANIKDVVLGYKGQGYEIVGMAWFQGWNDFGEWHLQLDGKRVGMGVIERYPHNLAAMFRDLRKDLDAPDMPIVIGELGVGGHEMTTRAQNPDDDEAVAMVKFRKAQKAVAEDPLLKNVTFVPTADFWDTRLQELRLISDAYWNEKQKKGIKDTENNHLPTKELNDEYWRLGGHWYCHYNGSATNYSLIGYALAEALNTGSNPAQATGDIVIADFEGPHRLHYGNYYASQLFSNAPGGRKIQIGWAQIAMPGMPFNQTFSFPHRLTLRTTERGIRMFAEPVKEIEKIYKKKQTAKKKKLTEVKPVRLDVSGDIFDVTATFELGDAKVLGLDIGGNRIEYNVKEQKLNNAPLKPVEGKITIRVLIDRPMMEIIGNHGRVFITKPREKKGDVETIEAFASGGTARLVKVEVNELESIWKK